MKLSQLPLRDVIALEVLPAYVAKHARDDAVINAYRTSDEMLKQIEGYQCRIQDAERKALAAETKLEVMRGYTFDGYGGERIALVQIWEMLGVQHQTAAMQVLREMALVVPASTAPLGRSGQ